jgi:single-stranded-DNA-specific exonuclease
VFREAFAAHAREALGDGPGVETEEIDAVVGPDDLGADVAEQLARLAPFGKGNPPVRLVVPAARIRDVRPMGEGERHARFSLEGATARARGVAFGVNGELSAAAELETLDVSLALELNHWNGAVEPRVVLGELYPPGTDPGDDEPDLPDPGQWAARLRAELEAPLDSHPPRRTSHKWGYGPPSPTFGDSGGGPRRAVVDRRRRSGVATVAALASSGEAVLVLCADALRRRALVERAAVPARFGGGRVAIAGGALCDAASRHGIEGVLAGGGVALADWARIERDPKVPAAFQHVVLIDPPPLSALEAMVDRFQGDGFLHLAWGAAEVELSLRLWEAEWPSRPSLAALYRRLRDAAGAGAALEGEGLRDALGGKGGLSRSPEAAARALRVLHEVGVVAWDPDGGAAGSGPLGTLGVVSSKGIELAQSQAFVAYRERHEEGRRYLSRRRNPT